MEIAGQPDALRRAAVALEDQRETLLALAEAATDGGGVVLTGMGSSYDACFPAVNELAARRVLALHIDTAELLHFRTEVLSPSTVLVVVSQSGRARRSSGSRTRSSNAPIAPRSCRSRTGWTTPWPGDRTCASTPASDPSADRPR